MVGGSPGEFSLQVGPRGSTTYHRSHREEIRVVAALLKVHHDVQQGDLVATTPSIEGFEISGKDVFVVFPIWRDRQVRFQGSQLTGVQYTSLRCAKASHFRVGKPNKLHCLPLPINHGEAQVRTACSCSLAFSFPQALLAPATSSQEAEWRQEEKTSQSGRCLTAFAKWRLCFHPAQLTSAWDSAPRAR